MDNRLQLLSHGIANVLNSQLSHGATPMEALAEVRSQFEHLVDFPDVVMWHGGQITPEIALRWMEQGIEEMDAVILHA